MKTIRRRHRRVTARNGVREHTMEVGTLLGVWRRAKRRDMIRNRDIKQPGKYKFAYEAQQDKLEQRMERLRASHRKRYPFSKHPIKFLRGPKLSLTKKAFNRAQDRIYDIEFNTIG